MNPDCVTGPQRDGYDSRDGHSGWTSAVGPLPTWRRNCMIQERPVNGRKKVESKRKDKMMKVGAYTVQRVTAGAQLPTP